MLKIKFYFPILKMAIEMTPINKSSLESSMIFVSVKGSRPKSLRIAILKENPGKKGCGYFVDSLNYLGKKFVLATVNNGECLKVLGLGADIV